MLGTFGKLLGLLCALPILIGCVQRVMKIDSQPSGALVYLNDQEVGRTPFTREFTWYGNYDVVVRKEGYQTLKTTAAVWPPFWQIIPLDLVTEALPLKDEHPLMFALKPKSDVDVDALLIRGELARAKLEGSGRSRPASQPVTQPAALPAQ